jgi:hypothetical protein
VGQLEGETALLR